MLYNSYQDDSPSSSTLLTRLLLTPVSMVQDMRTSTMNTYVTVKNYFLNKDTLSEMQAELNNLRKENVENRFKLRQLEAYREAMRFPHQEEFPGVVAIVVMRDSRLTESLIINRGLHDAIQKNLAVLSSEGLIGRTFDATGHFAKVQPLTDPSSALGIYVDGTSYEGVLRGGASNGQLLLTDLRLIDAEEENALPQPGQKVYTSGTGRVFPRNLFAGTVSAATSDQGIVVEPVVNIKSVKSVIVLTNWKLREEMLSLLDKE